jgi:aminoglycoside 3-N-acetyltransferase
MKSIFEKIQGKSVCVHSSFRSLKAVVESPQRFLNLLLNQGCTVIAPSFSFDFNATSNPPPFSRPLRNGWNYSRNYVDPESNPIAYSNAADYVDSDMGAIPRAILETPGRVRGGHPLCSFTGIGPNAHFLLDGQSNLDVFSPLRRLAESDGYILLAGVGFEALTLIHLAEQQAGREPFIRWALDANNENVGVAIGGCSNGFQKLEPLLGNLVHKVRLDTLELSLVPAKDALRSLVRIIRENPAITACSSPSCERCPDAINGGPILGSGFAKSSAPEQN